MTTLSVSGGSHNLTVYGNGTVFAGSGNDTIDVHGISQITAGSGNDWIAGHANGSIAVGSGADTISLMGDGVIKQTGAGGHDTINLGFGSDSIFAQGHASIYGEFGTATLSGGSLDVVNTGWNNHELLALTGNATLIGGEYTNKFVGGTGNVVMQGSGKMGPDTFIGGSGSDTMTGGANTNVFEVMGGGHHVITNFVTGQDQLYVEGHSMSYLMANGEVTISNGNTMISMDGGATTVELKGVGSLHSSDIITSHK